MRTILLSSAIILGFASHASAKGCPDTEKMKQYLTEFFSFSGSEIGDAFTKSLNEKYELELESPHIYMGSFIPGLTLEEEEEIRNNQKYTLCFYKYGRDTILSFLIKKK